MTRPTSRSARKIFHKIGEVCELTKTEPYVLRYWESEFPFLAPEKNRAGQRIYSDVDIEMVLAIKRLLYEEGYTTAGARRRLEKEREHVGTTASADEAARADTQGAEVSGTAKKGSAQRKIATAGETARASATQGASGAGASEDLRTELRRVRDELRSLREIMSPALAPSPSPRRLPRRK